MRIKITLKGKNNLEIPYNYNHTLSSLIYNTLQKSKREVEGKS